MQNRPMNFNVKGQKFSEKVSDSTFQLTLKKPPLSECLCFIKEKSQNLHENDIYISLRAYHTSEYLFTTWILELCLNA